MNQISGEKPCIYRLFKPTDVIRRKIILAKVSGHGNLVIWHAEQVSQERGAGETVSLLVQEVKDLRVFGLVSRASLTAG